MQNQKISKFAGGLLILTPLLGLILLGLDNVLRTGSPTHYLILILFVIVDFAIGIFVVVKPIKSAFWIAVGWNVLRITLQIADISQASTYQFSNYGQFADYLFNPASTISVSLGNPPGVPGFIIDLILILEAVVIVLVWRRRHELGAN